MKIVKNNREFSVGIDCGKAFATFKAPDLFKHDEWFEGGITLSNLEIDFSDKWNIIEMEKIWNNKKGEFDWTGNIETEAKFTLQIPRWTFKQPTERNDAKDFSCELQMSFKIVTDWRGNLQIALDWKEKPTRVPRYVFSERDGHVLNWSRGDGNIENNLLLWTGIKKINKVLIDALEAVLELESGMIEKKQIDSLFKSAEKRTKGDWLKMLKEQNKF